MVQSMKTLLIMRHAKSSWGDESLPDHERPLNARGERDAPRMGQLLRREGLIPQAILASTATRARASAQMVADACGFEGEIDFEANLYGAAPEVCRQVLSLLPDAVQIALVVAHNPGLEELLSDLTGEAEHLPTGAIAYIELALDRWAGLGLDTEAQLMHLWRPRDIT